MNRPAPRPALLLVLLLTLLLPAGPAQALPTQVHAFLCFQAAQLPGVPAEVLAYLGDPLTAPDSKTNATVIEGVYDEDLSRDPFNGGDEFDWSGLNSWGTHYWNPEGGPHGGRMTLYNLDQQNAFERAGLLFDQAVAAHLSGDRGRAYYLLGQAAHLLQDVSTPAHANLDLHLTDLFLEGDDSYESFLGARYPRSQAGLLGFLADFPATARSFGQEEDLYALFFPLAWLARGHDSDDADGLVDQGGWRGRSADLTSGQVVQVYASRDGVELESLASGWDVARNKKLTNFAHLPLDLPDRLVLTNSALAELKLSRQAFIVAEFQDGGRQALALSLFETGPTDIGDARCQAQSATLLSEALTRVAGLYALFGRAVR